MKEGYEKQAFVLTQLPDDFQVPERLTFRPVPSGDEESLIEIVARVMADSLDRSDRYDVSRLGSDRAAAAFLAEASEDFDYTPDWWELALNRHGNVVGFVLPVLFQDAEKEGLGEGTFYYIGVVPEQRGNNYGYDLLCRGTATLHEVGVWRIYSDTDVLNSPMINAFAKAGYEPYGPPKSVAL